MRNNLPLRFSFAFLCRLALYCSRVSAQISWVAGTGDYTAYNNWDTDITPGESTDVFISNGGTAQLMQQITADGITLGDGPNTSGNLEVSGAGNLILNGNYYSSYLGKSGMGTVNLKSGGKLVSQTAYLGYSQGASGSVFISDPGSIWTSQNYLAVGYGGAGLLDILNGGKLNGAKIVVGGTGPGSVFVMGTGTISSGSVVIGGDSGGGTVTIDGANAKWTSSTGLEGFSVGTYGPGELDLENGGTLQTGYGFIGEYASGHGTVNVNGANSTWTNTNALFLGGGDAVGGTGQLNVVNGGTVNVEGGVVLWGSGTVKQSDNGRIAVSDDLSSVPAVDGLYVGSGAHGFGTLQMTGNSLFQATSLNIGALGKATQAGTGRLIISRDPTYLPTGSGLFVSSANSVVTATVAGALSTTGGNIQGSSSGFTEVDVIGSNGKWTDAGPLTVTGPESFNSSTAMLKVSNGGDLSGGGAVTINSSATANGNGQIIQSGSGQILISTDTSSLPGAGVYVGSYAGPDTGSLTLNGESNLSANALTIGSGGIASMNGQSQIIVSDDPSQVPSPQIAPGVFVVSSNLAVTMTIAGTLSENVSTDFTPGATIDGNGINGATVNVIGSDAQWTMSGDLTVGNKHAGALNISSGGHVVSGRGTIGVQSQNPLVAISAVQVSGTGSQWVLDGDLVVGGAGVASLNVLSGGVVRNDNGINNVTIGDQPNSSLISTRVTVDGSGSELIAGNNLTVGRGDLAVLQIQNHGYVENGVGTIGDQATSDGEVIVNNAIWNCRNALNVGNFGIGKLQVKNGGLVKVGAAFTIQAGVGLAIGPGGTLMGTGTVMGNSDIVVENNGIVAPGHSPGTLNIEGSFIQDSGGRLQMQIASASSYDLLAVDGFASLAGTLEITLLNGYTPSPTSTFNLLSSFGRTGSFSDVLVSTSTGGLGSFNISLTGTGITLSNYQPLPGLAGDYNNDGRVDARDYIAWRNSSNPSQARYDLWRANFGNGSTAGLDGDYNNDGKVDARDYVVWRNSSNPSQTAYDLWRSNFGHTSGAGSGSSAAVPEPPTCLLILFATAAALGGPRSREV